MTDLEVSNMKKPCEKKIAPTLQFCKMYLTHLHKPDMAAGIPIMLMSQMGVLEFFYFLSYFLRFDTHFHDRKTESCTRTPKISTPTLTVPSGVHSPSNIVWTLLQIHLIRVLRLHRSGETAFHWDWIWIGARRMTWDGASETIAEERDCERMGT